MINAQRITPSAVASGKAASRMWWREWRSARAVISLGAAGLARTQDRCGV